MDRAGNVVNRVKGDVATLVAQRGAVIVFVVLALLMIVVVVAYLIWRISRSSLSDTTALDDPRKLNGKGPFTFSASRMPSSTVGQSYSLGFWLYLTDFQPTSQGKLLLMRSGQPNTNLTTANPIVFLDKAINQMHICIKTTRASSASGSPVNQLTDFLRTGGTGATNTWTYLTATVEYVPLQRWSHFLFTVQDSTLTVFQDGSIYTVKSLYDMVDTAPGQTVPRPMFSAASGDLTIGNAGSSISGDANGFIARVILYNYALATQEVQGIYLGGPTQRNLLRGMGVAAYGVRSPVYKVDEAGGDDK